MVVPVDRHSIMLLAVAVVVVDFLLLRHQMPTFDRQCLQSTYESPAEAKPHAAEHDADSDFDEIGVILGQPIGRVQHDGRRQEHAEIIQRGEKRVVGRANARVADAGKEATACRSLHVDESVVEAE